MERILVAIGMVVLLLLTTNAKADDFDSVDEQTENFDFSGTGADSEDAEFASIPNAGESQVDTEKPAALPQPPRVVSDQIETALDNLDEDQRERSYGQEETASLREEIRKLKKQCVSKTKSPKALAKKSKQAGKKVTKLKTKKTKVVSLKSPTPRKKKVSAVAKKSVAKRMIASAGAERVTELPKKKVR